MLFSACCIASCEPAQIHGSISNMKMEIQKMIWTTRYEKRGVNCGFRAYMRIEGVSTQLQSSGLVAHENSTFRNLALAVSGPFMA